MESCVQRDQEENAEDSFVLKVIYGYSTFKSHVKRGFRFSQKNTIQHATEKILEKENIPQTQINSFGLFKKGLGWLDPALTFSTYQIKGDVRFYRQKF